MLGAVFVASHLIVPEDTVICKKPAQSETSGRWAENVYPSSGLIVWQSLVGAGQRKEMEAEGWAQWGDHCGWKQRVTSRWASLLHLWVPLGKGQQVQSL